MLPDPVLHPQYILESRVGHVWVGFQSLFNGPGDVNESGFTADKGLNGDFAGQLGEYLGRAGPIAGEGD